MGLSILFSAPYMVPEFERFKPILERADITAIVPELKERLSESELLNYAGRFDGAICGDDQYTSKVLEKSAPRLRVICKWGTGIDSIDLEAAKKLGIEVRNTPDAFTEAVADSVMSYVLAFARGTPWMDRAVKNGRWEKRPAKALHECRLGVVGVGRIGKAVLRRAKEFGMRLMGNDVAEVDPDFVSQWGVEMVPLEVLLPRCDFVSLNCDLNPTSFQLIAEEELQQMSPTAVLINTARGSVIDEHALVEALRSQVIAGAALDVFEDEPLPADSPLRKMDNVLLAPHNANSSPSAWERVHWNTLRNLFEGLGLPPPKPEEFGSDAGKDRGR